VTAAVAIFLSGVLLASVGQLLMKIAALRGRETSLWRSFLDPYLIAGYVLMLLSTVTSTIALKVLPLRMTAALLPLGYVFVMILSATVLAEPMGRRQVWGALVILAGVVVFNLGAR
jgi:drug/metabolite transporter (DMT)-like permease